MTPPCPKCGHPQGTHNYSYGCQRKACDPVCQEFTKNADDPNLRYNVARKEKV